MIGTVKNMLQNYTTATQEKQHDVLGVFDMYVVGSTKNHECLRRAGMYVWSTLRLTLAMSFAGKVAIIKSDNKKRELVKGLIGGNMGARVWFVTGEETCVIRQGHQHIQRHTSMTLRHNQNKAECPACYK